MTKKAPVLDASLSATDLANTFLEKHGSPMHWSELLDAIVAVKRPEATPAEGAKIRAALYTEVNLDNRFNYIGDGLWGLRDWAPKGQSSTRAVPLATSLRGRREKVHRDEEVFAGEDEEEENRGDEIDQIRHDEEAEEDEWEEPEEA